MKNCVCRALDTFDQDCAIGGMKQCSRFGNAITRIFMRLLDWMTLYLPTGSAIGLSLIGTGFIFAPHTQAQYFAHLISLLNQFFFASASGSVTITVPALR